MYNRSLFYRRRGLENHRLCVYDVTVSLLLKTRCWRDWSLLLALEWFEKSMTLYTIASVDHITLAEATCSISVFDVCPGMTGMNWLGGFILLPAVSVVKPERLNFLRRRQWKTWNNKRPPTLSYYLQAELFAMTIFEMCYIFNCIYIYIYSVGRCVYSSETEYKPTIELL